MIDTMDYAPFPEEELLAMADHEENIGKAWSDATSTGAKLRKEHMDRAAVCRNAIKSFNALRERMLLAEFGHRHGVPEADGSQD